MIALFLALTTLNLLCLAVATIVGYATSGHDVLGIHPPPGMHLLSGVFAAFVCCAVHCIVFTYFIATAKWVQHAIVVKQLDPTSGAPTRSFRAQAFPAAILAMAIVFATAFSGAAVDNYGMPKWVHHAMALASLVINAAVAGVEYRAIWRNSRLIDSILEAIQRAAPAA
jgi:hypothetical protein